MYIYMHIKVNVVLLKEVCRVIFPLDVDSPFILLSNYVSKFLPLVTSGSVGVAESHVAVADSPDLYDLQRDSGAGCFAWAAPWRKEPTWALNFFLFEWFSIWHFSLNKWCFHKKDWPVSSKTGRQRQMCIVSMRIALFNGCFWQWKLANHIIRYNVQLLVNTNCSSANHTAASHYIEDIEGIHWHC